MCRENSISDNKKVAAYARSTRSGERGTEAAPATSERYAPVPDVIGIP
jgi:hypothetical protein